MGEGDQFGGGGGIGCGQTVMEQRRESGRRRWWVRLYQRGLRCRRSIADVTRRLCASERRLKGGGREGSLGQTSRRRCVTSGVAELHHGEQRRRLECRDNGYASGRKGKTRQIKVSFVGGVHDGSVGVGDANWREVMRLFKTWAVTV